MSGRAEGALPPDHHQLPGGQPGCGRPAGGVAGHALGRVPGGEECYLHDFPLTLFRSIDLQQCLPNFFFFLSYVNVNLSVFRLLWSI